MIVMEKEKQVLRILEQLEIAAACPDCGGLSMEIWGGSPLCPHCANTAKNFTIAGKAPNP